MSDNEPDDEEVVDDGAEEQTDEVVDTGETEPVADSDGAVEKNVLLAVLATWFLPGLGHFYVDGLEARGLVFLVCAFISYPLMLVVVGFFTTPLLVVAASYDAYKRAEKHNAQLA